MNFSDLLASLASGKGLNITPGNPAMDLTQLVSQVGHGGPQAPMPMAPNLPGPQSALPGAPVAAMNLGQPNPAQTGGGYMGVGSGLAANLPKTPLPPPETELTAPKGTSPMTTGSIAPASAPAATPPMALGGSQTPDFSHSFGEGLINVGNALQGKGVADLAADTLEKNQTYKALIAKGLDPASAEAAVRNPALLQSVLPSLFNPLVSLDVQAKKNDIAMQPLREQLLKAQIANAGTKPSFTTIGHDAFGQPTYGFVDARTGVVTPVSNPQSSAAAAPPGMEGPTGEEYLKTLPKPIADQIKAISEGRMPIPGGFALKTPYWQQMMTHVSQYDPTFDAVNYNSRAKTRNDFTSGKSAQNITSFNTAIGHLGELDEAIKGLGNSDFVPVNAANNATSGVNAKRAAALAKFNTARNAVVEELTRAFKGTGGSLTEVQNWEKLIDPNASPAALNEAVKTAVNLLESRIDSVGEQYNKGMGLTSDPLKLLSPKAQKIWQTLNGSGTQPAAPATPSSNAPAVQAITPTSKADYDALPSGTPFIDPNGQQRVKP